jgi:cysteine-rich repeat protein
LDAGEECDDNNAGAGDGCSDVCTIEPGYICSGQPSVCVLSCGNGTIDGGEGCDDNNTTNGDGCSANCQVETGWSCSGQPSVCSVVCGDGLIISPENCDDQNTLPGDGCSDICEEEQGWNCSGEPSVCSTACGDGTIAGSETCDDGDMDNGDGCDASCQVETGWTCSGEPSTCTADCGDGNIVGGEACDDQNTSNGDGCDDLCQEEPGWNCSGEPSVCSTTCGDGIIAGSEICDDGDMDNGDGCDASCQEEPGWTCSGEPSMCTFNCTDHSQCSYICDVNTGSCVAEADILFVNCNNAAAGSGTLADPYNSLQTAVDNATAGQFILVLPSICQEQVQISAVDVQIVGQAGATVQTAGCPTMVVTGVTATIELLHIDGGGISVTGGAVATVHRNLIGAGDCVGVSCNGSTCIIDRNTITANDLGGVEIDNSDYRIINNMIFENGSNNTDWGGARLDAPGASTAEFVNNTVAFNDCQPSANNTGGVLCDSAATLTNCILWENRRHEATGCTVRYSDISEAGFAGNNGNIEQDPLFANSGADDYHIQTGSPCIDSGDPAGVPPAPTLDFDGDSRPMGAGVDMGADEAQ